MSVTKNRIMKIVPVVPNNLGMLYVRSISATSCTTTPHTAKARRFSEMAAVGKAYHQAQKTFAVVGCRVVVEAV